ncbi:MAG TPA: hypothetical protein VM842_09320 [Nitrospira sp.]|nr:hypothetical protein [Nitrospira sp.]
MRSVILFLAVTLVLWLNVSGCTASRGINRQALLDSIRHHPDASTTQAMGASLSPESRLPAPYRLALFFHHKDFPGSAELRKVDWVSADANVIQRALEPLKQEGAFQESFVLANSSVQGRTLRDIRSAAARYNADAILVIDGGSIVDRYNNGHAWWYMTGFGAYLAHGTESHALFMMEGTMWDVRSGHLYATPRAEGETTLVGPATSLEDRTAIAEAKRLALEKFGSAFADTLRRLKENHRVSN